MRSLVVSLVLLGWAGAGCSGGKAQPVDEVVLCDRSSSAGICSEEVVRAAGEAFLGANPPPGSRFVVLVVGCGIEDVMRNYEIKVPDRWGRGAVRKRRRWQEDEHRRLASLALPAVNQCSAVAAGIWRAARVESERPNSIRRLVLISDLREVDRSLGVNFERRVATAADFVGKLRKAQLLADLSGIQVGICGVHDRATPDAPTWTARKAQQLRLAWTGAFAAMGASDVRLTESCDFGNVRSPITVAQEGR
jgi:hypothetical protein